MFGTRRSINLPGAEQQLGADRLYRLTDRKTDNVLGPIIMWVVFGARLCTTEKANKQVH